MAEQTRVLAGNRFKDTKIRSLSTAQAEVLNGPRRYTISSSERQLAARARAGDIAARDKMITDNVGLVAVIARRYRCSGLGLDDLIQDGTLGLMRACQDFDPETHMIGFGSYAAIWIRSFMYRAVVRHRSLIRLPRNVAYRRQSIGLNPEDRGESESGTVGGGARGQERAQCDIERGFGVGLASENRDMVRIGGRHGVREDCDSVCLEELAIDRTLPEASVCCAEEYERLGSAMALLSPVELWVVSERYGLVGLGWWQGKVAPAEERSLAVCQNKRGLGISTERCRRKSTVKSRAADGATYKALGARCGLSIYRVRQIERTALTKLKKLLG
jgi:RNA polymerase sigma factor (sigma-70 family)